MVISQYHFAQRWLYTYIYAIRTPLGPLLFIICINDLSNVSNHMMFLLFADDTNIFVSGKDVAKLQHEVQMDLNRISEWLNINKLSLNIKKTFHGI